MSLSLLGKIIEDKEITDLQEWAVLSALADATNKETMLCYPSLARISDVARCSRQTVIRTMTRMEKKGWIQVIRRKRPDGVNLANTYRIIKYGEGSVTEALPVVSAGDYVVSDRQKGSVPQTLRGSAPQAPKPIREEIREEPPLPPKGGSRARAREQREKLAADVSLLSLPLFLQGADFLKALQRWVDHRKMLRKPMTQWALELVVKKCEKWGKEAAIQNINYSIGRGWQDVFPKRDEPRPPKDRDDPRSCL